jgi:23S rRNA pseudouridine1911/1915/1917 synthase
VVARIVKVDPADPRTRLDVFLAAHLGSEYSRSQAARMIKAGFARLNGAPARASEIVRPGDVVEILSPPAQAAAALPEVAPPEIEVLFADDDLIVVNKPAGMTVHPAPGHPAGTLVDALLGRYPDMAEMNDPDGVRRPGIVHRLDKDSSGVMVVARTSFARMELARQFKDRTVSKIYFAIVRGLIRRDRFTIERPIGRHPVERKRMSVHSRHPRAATSQVTVLARLALPHGDVTLAGVAPMTGRTHQIRIHLASIGHPCLCDRLYGGHQGQSEDGGASPFSRQALHALALFLRHPRTAEPLRFVASLPADFEEFLARRGIIAGPEAIQRWIQQASEPLQERLVDSPERLR